MKTLIIPGLPIAAIYLSQGMAYLPMPLAGILIIVGLLVFIGSLVTLCHLFCIPSPFRIKHKAPTYLYGMDFGRGTSKAPTAQEYCRPPKGPRQYID